MRLADGHDHYEVSGRIKLPRRFISIPRRFVEFSCQGTRLHSAKGEFIEIIRLNFAHCECVVYVKTGTVRFRDRRTGERWTEPITPMNAEGYDRVFSSIMRDFVAALDGGPRTHTPKDLRVITEAAVALTAPQGEYSYAAR